MSSNGDAFGSLAALFTSGPAGGAPSPQPSAKEGPSLGAVTTVLVGNVPVMAGLWTTQLADEVAKSGGPTALVRFERDDVTLELLRADGRQLPPAGPAAVTRWLPRARAAAGAATLVPIRPTTISSESHGGTRCPSPWASQPPWAASHSW